MGEKETRGSGHWVGRASSCRWVKERSWQRQQEKRLSKKGKMRVRRRPGGNGSRQEGWVWRRRRRRRRVVKGRGEGWVGG